MKKFIRPTILFLVLCLALGLLPAAFAADGAPIAENLEIETYRGVSVEGNLAAVDPDGETVRFEITTQPVKGTIELDDDGSFVYTPADGKRGKDYFGYKAIDSSGNYSQEATVIIRIQKQKTQVSYSDMSGNGAEYAAVRLAEEGVYTGAYVAGDYVFSPDAPVTREEFLTMSLMVAGTETLSGVSTTGFADDEAISAWARPYVSTALSAGIISGCGSEATGAVFEPDRAISAAEAAVMLDKALGLTNAVSTWFAYEEAVPAWAQQSAANVSSCGLMPAGLSFQADTLTRAEAAEMLVGAIRLMENR
ncbi:MAG: Ig-like domain-containing protein [Oscillospiraceae bacterium]